MTDLAKQIIEKEKKERTGNLDLGICGLTEIPQELLEMDWVTGFSLSNYPWETKNKGDVNQISDITILSKLPQLQSLNLGNNQISDISSLSALSDLQYLEISDNPISDISSLSGLTNLKSLNLSDNQISDISALGGLINLNTLDLIGNQI